MARPLRYEAVGAELLFDIAKDFVNPIKICNETNHCNAVAFTENL